MFSKIYIWCKNEDKQNVFCFPKDIPNEDIIDYIEGYGYSTYKETTRKQYKNFKRNYINKNEI